MASADSVETLGVDQRTRVNRLGAKEKARRKKCKVRFSLLKKNKAFQKSYMKVGVKKLLRVRMLPARTWRVYAVGMSPTERLKLRRLMAAAAGQKSTISLSLFMETCLLARTPPPSPPPLPSPPSPPPPLPPSLERTRTRTHARTHAQPQQQPPPQRPRPPQGVFVQGGCSPPGGDQRHEPKRVASGCTRRSCRRHIQCPLAAGTTPALVVATRAAERRSCPHLGPSPQRWSWSGYAE